MVSLWRMPYGVEGDKRLTTDADIKNPAARMPLWFSLKSTTENDDGTTTIVLAGFWGTKSSVTQQHTSARLEITTTNTAIVEWMEDDREYLRCEYHVSVAKHDPLSEYTAEEITNIEKPREAATWPDMRRRGATLDEDAHITPALYEIITEASINAIRHDHILSAYGEPDTGIDRRYRYRGFR